MIIPSQKVIQNIINRYREIEKSKNFKLLYIEEDYGDTYVNTWVIADSIKYDMKFDNKYKTV